MGRQGQRVDGSDGGGGARVAGSCLVPVGQEVRVFTCGYNFFFWSIREQDRCLRPARRRVYLCCVFPRRNQGLLGMLARMEIQWGTLNNAGMCQANRPALIETIV